VVEREVHNKYQLGVTAITDALCTRLRTWLAQQPAPGLTAAQQEKPSSHPDLDDILCDYLNVSESRAITPRLLAWAAAQQPALTAAQHVAAFIPVLPPEATP
jgi:hypothetical protein